MQGGRKQEVSMAVYAEWMKNCKTHTYLLLLFFAFFALRLAPLANRSEARVFAGRFGDGSGRQHARCALLAAEGQQTERSRDRKRCEVGEIPRYLVYIFLA